MNKDNKENKDIKDKKKEPSVSLKKSSYSKKKIKKKYS